jgi:hypothetical protein
MILFVRLTLFHAEQINVLKVCYLSFGPMRRLLRFGLFEVILTSIAFVGPSPNDLDRFLNPGQIARTLVYERFRYS